MKFVQVIEQYVLFIVIVVFYSIILTYHNLFFQSTVDGVLAIMNNIANTTIQNMHE